MAYPCEPKYLNTLTVHEDFLPSHLKFDLPIVNNNPCANTMAFMQNLNYSNRPNGLGGDR